MAIGTILAPASQDVVSVQQATLNLSAQVQMPSAHCAVASTMLGVIHAQSGKILESNCVRPVSLPKIYHRRPHRMPVAVFRASASPSPKTEDSEDKSIAEEDETSH